MSHPIWVMVKSFLQGNLKPVVYVASVATLMTSLNAISGPREQAKRIHDRLTGTPPSESVLNDMQADIQSNQALAAAFTAMSDDAFYSVTLKNWITPWTNEEQTVFAPLNDYTATVIGMIRDDHDIRTMLYNDIIYTAPGKGLPAYANNSNAHYEAMESQALPLGTVLQESAQSTVTGLESAATAGVMTTRAAAKSFLKDGTNRAMFRFTLMNHFCGDLEPLKDIERAADRIRQDVSRSPGGDSRIFMNSCYGCHSGMDPMIQSFAYYNYDYDVEGDPEGNNGSLGYNTTGTVDQTTGNRVQSKYHINNLNFPPGFVTTNDDWVNYWRKGPNQLIGWDSSLSGQGSGAKSMGQELAHSAKFARCQVEKVFKNVCLREPVDANDRSQVDAMISSLASNSYRLKQTFAESAVYCMGE